jgi:hypothetical protein
VTKYLDEEGNELTREDWLRRLNEDIAAFMTDMSVTYKADTQQVARALTTSLGVFISLNAADPRKALDFVAASIRNTNYAQIRADHFGSGTLGIHQDEKPKIATPHGEDGVIIGDFRGKPT